MANKKVYWKLSYCRTTFAVCGFIQRLTRIVCAGWFHCSRAGPNGFTAAVLPHHPRTSRSTTPVQSSNFHHIFILVLVKKPLFDVKSGSIHTPIHKRGAVLPQPSLGEGTTWRRANHIRSASWESGSRSLQ